MKKEIKPPIRFKFNVEKFTACVAMLAQAEVPELTKLKIVKMLYFIDKYHLLKYGKPVLGDIYYHWDHGPVPLKSLTVLNEVVDDDDISGETGESDKDHLTHYLKLNKFRAKIIPRKYPFFELKNEPYLDSLSFSEQEAVREVIKQYGQFSPWQLREETHKDTTWKATDRNDEIDYRLFFEDGSSSSKGALEYLESLREDNEFVFGLSQ
ncbi:MAG: Panacea domain-containing protein [Candidatus Omnitrophota bacterium]